MEKEWKWISWQSYLIDIYSRKGCVSFYKVNNYWVKIFTSWWPLALIWKTCPAIDRLRNRDRRTLLCTGRMWAFLKFMLMLLGWDPLVFENFGSASYSRECCYCRLVVYIYCNLVLIRLSSRQSQSHSQTRSTKFLGVTIHKCRLRSSAACSKQVSINLGMLISLLCKFNLPPPPSAARENWRTTVTDDLGENKSRIISKRQEKLYNWPTSQFGARPMLKKGLAALSGVHHISVLGNGIPAWV